MLIYAGIDEAGYGPMLGPLCVGMSAFVLRDHDPASGAPNVWGLLDEAVCRSRRDVRKRIAIDDSKKLKGSSKSGRIHPLKHLERGVLSFLEQLPGDDVSLFAQLGAEVVAHPWHDSITPLPVGNDTDALHIDVARLQRAMNHAGVECGLLRCFAIDPRDYNDGLTRMGRKSNVNFHAAMRHVEAIWTKWPDEHPRVIIDRQGGRTHYLNPLKMTFPEAELRIIAETEDVSRYEMIRGGSELTVSFIKGSEDHHFPAALASMTAKYVRELLMLRLNRYFQGHLPELKPTAGYVQDGRRYLREIEPIIAEQNLCRDDLIRRA